MATDEFSLSLTPAARYDAIDVTGRIAAHFGDVLARHSRALYCSLHTTAGYLEESLANRLLRRDGQLVHFFQPFQTVFPPGAEYHHDQLHLRAELSDEQKAVEPRNADSHLTFIGAGMRNCATYRTESSVPVFFIDLDGTWQGKRRSRSTTVLAYDRAEFVERLTLPIPVSRHPVDSINLNDPRAEFAEQIAELLRKHGIERGRVDITLEQSERNAGLTVNEYETLLMRHDLAEVLRNPLRFAAIKGAHMLGDLRAVPGKTIDYAKYDLVLLFNQLMEALHVDESVVERLLSRLIAFPADRFLRMKRGISFGVSETNGVPSLIRGRYQSPILVQWRNAERQERRVEVALHRFL
ncbi:MAG: hypothetical protein ABIR28_05565 [Vicinamibacteria bacterium]